MRSWQIRNILATVAVAVWCGVATAGPESAAPETPSASETQSETKKSTDSSPETKKNTAATETKESTTPSATKKSATPSATKKSATAATAKSTKTATSKKPKTTVQAKTKKAKPAPAPVKAAAPQKAPPATAATPKAETPTPAKPMRIAAPGKMRTVPGRVTGGGVGVLPRVDGPASTTPDVGLQGVKDRATWAPTDICEDTDKKLEGTVRGIDKEASKNGERLVMARIAAQFRVPAETILSEKTRLGASWGELAVAHTLLASARGVTVDQLFDMRAEGMGWGRISYGLGFKQKDVTTAVQTEAKVMRGQSKPNGTPTKIATMDPMVAAEATAHAGGSSAPDAGTSDDEETAVPESGQK